MSHAGLAEAIRDRLGECSPAERKVARTLLAAYPSAGFETVARLAERAGVSGPTVVRFATRLGYRGFPDFQQALREDLDERSALREVRPRLDAALPDDDLLVRAGGVALDSVRRTLARLPPHELQEAVSLLTGKTRRIHLVGGRFSHLLARYLGQHLHQMREGAAVVPDLPQARAAAVADLGARDVLVVFDYRRYEEQAAVLARYAVRQHAKVLLFTDVWLSPIAAVSEVVLSSETAAAASYDAMAPAMTLVELVVAGVLDELGETASERLGRAEQVAGELSVR